MPNRELDRKVCYSFLGKKSSSTKKKPFGGPGSVRKRRGAERCGVREKAL